MAAQEQEQGRRVPWIRFPGVWVIVAAGVQGFIGYFWPLNAYWPVAVRLMTAEMKWSAAEVGMGATVGRIGGMFANPAGGWACDNWGPRYGTAAFLGLMGIGFIGVAFMTEVWQMVFLYGVILYFAMTGGTYRQGYTATNRWWMDLRAFGIAAVTLFGGLSGVFAFVMPPMMDAWGWRGGAWAAAITLFGIAVPIAWLYPHHMPEDYGLAVDNAPPELRAQRAAARAARTGQRVVVRPPLANITVGEAMRGRTFWLLTLALLFSGFAYAPVTLFQNLRMAALGYSVAEASVWMSAFFTCSYVGRFTVLFIGDWFTAHYPPRLVMGVAYIVMAVGLSFFAFGTEPIHFMIWAVVFGIGFGFTVPYLGALMGAYFGRQAFGTIYGLVVGIAAVGGASAPAMVGWISDVSGNWLLAFMILAVGYVLAGITIFFATPPSQQARERVRA